MPDLDDLLSPRIVTAAADSARRPPVASLAARGIRRRRVRNGSALVGAAVAVSAIVVAAAQLRPSPDATPSPAPQPTSLPSVTTPAESPSPSTSAQRKADRLTQATAVVRASDAKIASVVVTPDEPDRRISEWYTCAGADPCQSGHYALTVTADDYGHSTVVPLPVSKGFYGVEPAGSSHFVVTLGHRPVGVVDLQGHVRRIDVSGPAGPATGQESVEALARPPVAVDPTTGRAHPFLVPAGSRGVDDVSGRLWASGSPSHVEWSDDLGARWHSIALPPGAARKPFFAVPSADPDVAALVSFDFAINSNVQWDATLRSVGGGAFTSVPAAAPHGSSVAASGVVVLPDGRLLVLITSWSSWQTGLHTPAGFYTGADWSHLQPVRAGAPFAGLDYSTAPTVLGITTYGDVVTIYATPPDGTAVYTSTDAGATWTRQAAR